MKPGKKPLTEERFWEKTSPASSGCWEWLGRRNEIGRPLIGDKTRSNAAIYAYRLAWAFAKNGGVLPPKEIHIHHLCLNSGCCNPDHLIAVTAECHQALHRPPLCPKGHDPSRMIIRIVGGRKNRMCLECHRLRAVPWNELRKAEARDRRESRYAQQS